MDKDEERKERSLLYFELGFYKGRASSLYRLNQFLNFSLYLISGGVWCFVIVKSGLSDEWKIGLITLLAPIIIGVLKLINDQPSPEKDFNNLLKKEAEELKLRESLKDKF